MEQSSRSEPAAGYIVVGMDFSTLSLAAARWTARHMVAGEQLVLVHAICVPEPPSFLKGLQPPIEPLVDDARRGADVRMREVVATLGGVRVFPEIRIGRPDEVLLDVAREYRAELLV